MIKSLQSFFTRMMYLLGKKIYNFKTWLYLFLENPKNLLCYFYDKHDWEYKGIVPLRRSEKSKNKIRSRLRICKNCEVIEYSPILSKNSKKELVKENWERIKNKSLINPDKNKEAYVEIHVRKIFDELFGDIIQEKKDNNGDANAK